jgi:hypothetical protein
MSAELAFTVSMPALAVKQTAGPGPRVPNARRSTVFELQCLAAGDGNQ